MGFHVGVSASFVRLTMIGLMTCFAVACAQEDDHEHIVTLPGPDPQEEPADQSPQPQPQPQPSPSPSPKPVQSLTVRFDRLQKFDPETESKVREAARLMNQVFASEAFFNSIKNHSYNGAKQFVQNNGFANVELYDFMQLGRETYSPVNDRRMNLELVLYYADNNVVGYTYKGGRTIYVNSKFYSKYSPAQITRNLTHEWLHKAGFSHDSAATSRRPYSVPYAVGGIVERLSRRL
jgi:hypothetical protein